MIDDLKGNATDAEWLSFLHHHPSDKVKAAHKEILRLRAENEKLRALLEEARGWVDRGESGWQDFVYQIDAAIETP